MGAERKMIFIKLAIVLFFSFLLSGCGNQTIDYGPCKFAPPDSKFTSFSGVCEECYFNLQFRDGVYSFIGKQLHSEAGGDYSHTYNAVLSFYLDSPKSNLELVNSVGVKKPLQKVSVLSKSGNTPEPVSAAFGIYNYCNEFFEPITDNVNQSYHRLTSIELIDSYPAEINSEPIQFYYYYCVGELNATIIIDGKAETIIGSYRLKMEIYEKL